MQTPVIPLRIQQISSVPTFATLFCRKISSCEAWETTTVSESHGKNFVSFLEWRPFPSVSTWWGKSVTAAPTGAPCWTTSGRPARAPSKRGSPVTLTLKDDRRSVRPRVNALRTVSSSAVRCQVSRRLGMLRHGARVCSPASHL